MSETEVQKATRAFEEQIECAMETFKIDRPAATQFVCDRPEGRAAYAAMELAKKAAFAAVPISKATDDRIAKAKASLAALNEEVLAFGRQHNLAPADARHRLGEVDPSFSKRFKAAYSEDYEAERVGFLERQNA